MKRNLLERIINKKTYIYPRIKRILRIMKIYIVQADYEDIDPEGYYDSEAGGYESVVYQCKDIKGIYPALEDAKRGVRRAIKDDVWNNPTEKDFDIIEVDTESIGDNGFLMKVL